MRVLALDYGAVRTGVAVTDASGSIARPLTVVERAASEDGLERIAGLVREQDAEVVVVGLPLTLRGERGEQASETEQFVDTLRRALDVPVEGFDERFTTDLAERDPGSRNLPADARAAASARRPR